MSDRNKWPRVNCRILNRHALLINELVDMPVAQRVGHLRVDADVQASMGKFAPSTLSTADIKVIGHHLLPCNGTSEAIEPIRILCSISTSFIAFLTGNL